jgi:signal transduction histidine kinase
MTIAMSSFRARLVLGAVIWISLGFAISWGVLSSLLRAHVLHEFASELDHHATELAELAEHDPSGAIAIRAPLSDARFSLDRSGYYWQISQIGGTTLTSDSLGNARLPLELVPDGGPDLREAEVFGPSGPAMLLERLIRIGTPSGPAARVAVAMDMSLIRGYVGALENTLAIAMACLAGGLIFAAVAQITFALRPLARIDTALQAVKHGEARRMPMDLPMEVRPLVDNLNALLDKNEAMSQRARLQAGNLAHALKTSLAHLQIEADSLTDKDQSGAVIQRQCDIIRRQIDYQLARARATASRAGASHATKVGPAIENVAAAMRRLPGNRLLTIETDTAHSGALVACGPEDLEEVLGNLIDNAAKWARKQVMVSSTLAQGKLVIRIEDDGPGMPADMHEFVFKPGERLDESSPGSGLGLAIARDVVGLFDGRLWIERSRFGGACVAVELDQVI